MLTGLYLFLIAHPPIVGTSLKKFFYNKNFLIFVFFKFFKRIFMFFFYNF